MILLNLWNYSTTDAATGMGGKLMKALMSIDKSHDLKVLISIYIKPLKLRNALNSEIHLLQTGSIHLMP
jgi:hypothetical protein